MPQNLTQAVAFCEPDLPRTTMENQIHVGEEVETTHFRFPQKAGRCSAGLRFYNIPEREIGTSASTNSIHYIL